MRENLDLHTEDLLDEAYEVRDEAGEAYDDDLDGDYGEDELDEGVLYEGDGVCPLCEAPLREDNEPGVEYVLYCPECGWETVID